MGKGTDASRLAVVVLPGGAVVCAAVWAVAASRSVWTGALAVATAFAGAVAWALRRRSGRKDAESRLWRWFSWGTACLAGGFALELVFHAVVGDGSPTNGLGLTLGAVTASPLVYQGLVHWNRYRTLASDPGDWLNGGAAVIALMALATMADVRTGSNLDAYPGQVHGVLLQVASLLVLLGTAGTIIGLGALHQDRRAWVLVGGLGAALLVPVLVAVLRLDGRGMPDLPPLVASTAAAWFIVVLALLIASRLRSPVWPPRHATSQSTTVGALVVLGASIGTLVSNAVDADPALRWSSLLAGGAAIIACFRVVRLVSELAQVALSRLEARTDDLTGIPNRRRLTELLAEALPATGGRTLLVIDLERFKDVNDRFGHHVGDGVLRVIADRLQSRLGSRGTVARLGGDEFACVVDSGSVEASRDLADELLAAVRTPVEAEGRELQVDASIGVASTALSGGASEELMRCADAAMYAAKRAGGGVSVYDTAVDALDRAERGLVEDLRLLLTGGAEGPGGAGEIVVHYQPQLEAGSGRVVGVEALVRWHHPARGLLGPPVFLHLAERQGLMFRVTEAVLDSAVREVAGWRPPHDRLRLSVNLSSSCLAAPGLLEMMDAALARHGLPPRRMIAEVTETSVLEDVRSAVEVTRALATRGIAISIDDFGTGYSSLARLNVLPAEELKLDRSFTMQLTTDGRTAAIVAGTIDFAHRLGMRVVAEGVEDDGTLRALEALGCDVTQGYLHARPLPAAELREWLAARRRRDPVATDTSSRPGRDLEGTHRH